MEEGSLSNDWSYAAARTYNNEMKWVEVSRYPRTKRVIDTKDVSWTNNYKSFYASDKKWDPLFKGGYPFWVGSTQIWCTEKLSPFKNAK